MEVLIVLSRWLHVMAAALAIGGTFFMRVILPLGLAQADATSREAVHLRCRRAFKMTIHPCILIFLLTGAFNTWVNWGDYRLNRPLMHGLWGPHMFFGLIAIVVALVLLAPKDPPAWRKAGMTFNLIILATAVLLASTLKFVRDREVKKSTQPASISAPAR